MIPAAVWNPWPENGQASGRCLDFDYAFTARLEFFLFQFSSFSGHPTPLKCLAYECEHPCVIFHLPFEK